MPDKALRTSLGFLPAILAREADAAAAARTEAGKLLLAKDLRTLADADQDLNLRLAGVTDLLEKEKQAAQAWRMALAEAVKQWEASLAALSH